jgi:hypothetical protein
MTEIAAPHGPITTYLLLPLLQGYGTFLSPDGSQYQGGWSANLKHGLGKKTYGNGDFYEGLWRHGKAEGPGRSALAGGRAGGQGFAAYAAAGSQA